MPHDGVAAIPMKKALVGDLFCGAGGSSAGAARALRSLGYEMILTCVNHWSVAISTHQLNHPTARHYCEDVNVAKPIELVPEGKLDLLMASPSCVYHSRARGGKPINDQGRMDPFAVIRWCTELRVKRLLVENVPEFVSWGPINLTTGKPLKRRQGEYFRAWVASLQAIGFKVEWRVLNAADFGDATTRSRFFLLARSDGKRIHWPEPSHCKSGTDLLSPLQRWRAARDIIDWSLQGRSIFDRKRPLSPKTLARIYAGAVKFRWPEPFLVILRNHMDAQSIDGPVPTITTGRGKGGAQIYLAEPFVFDAPAFTLANGSTGAARHIDQPLMTITTGGASNERHPGCARPAVIEPFVLNRHGDNGAVRAHDIGSPMSTADCRGAGYVVEPFVISPRHGRAGAGPSPRSANDPLPTLTAGGSQVGIVEPFISAQRDGNAPASADEPLPTLTTKAQVAVVEPFVCGNRTNNTAKPIDGPIGGITTTTGGGQFIVEPISVEPFVLSQASGGAPRSIVEPIPTITTGGNGSAHALVAPYYGSGSGETCGSPDNPLPTVTAKARFGLVVPVTNSNGGPVARSIEQPLPTMTTAKGGEFAMVMPVTHGDDPGRFRSPEDPLPTITGAPRGELAFIEGVADRITQNAGRLHALAALHQPYKPVPAERLYDIRFRMLEPAELARAMGFHDDEIPYAFVGTKTDVTRQIGNAVCVNVATALVRAIMSN